MLTINRSQVSVQTEPKLFLSVEASEVGLGPGEWPDFIAVLDDKNEGILFGPSRRMVTSGGDVIEAEYYSRSGVALHVLND